MKLYPLKRELIKKRHRWRGERFFTGQSKAPPKSTCKSVPPMDMKAILAVIALILMAPLGMPLFVQNEHSSSKNEFVHENTAKSRLEITENYDQDLARLHEMENIKYYGDQ